MTTKEAAKSIPRQEDGEEETIIFDNHGEEGENGQEHYPINQQMSGEEEITAACGTTSLSQTTDVDETCKEKDTENTDLEEVKQKLIEDVNNSVDSK